MSEEMEKTSLMDKYIKIRLGGAAYRVRLMTLLLFAAAAIILIAAILILAFSGSCAKSKAKAAVVEATATATIEATSEPTAVPTFTPAPTEATAATAAPDPGLKTAEQRVNFLFAALGAGLAVIGLAAGLAIRRRRR